MKHKLKHKEEVKGGNESYSHHYKMAMDHMKMLHKMAKDGAKHHKKMMRYHKEK